jgi:hypothetical protein
MRWGAVQAENDDFRSGSEGGAADVRSHESTGVLPLPWERRLGLYALIQPFVGGRRVIELWPHLEGEGEHLRAAGASDVVSLSPSTPSLPMEEAAVDLVLCPNFLPAASPAEAAAWFREMARILAPGGLCVLRAPASGIGGAGAAEAGGESGMQAWIPAGLFADSRIVAEVAFGGVSFRVGGTEDMAIVGDLSPLAEPADFEIWIASLTPSGLPELGESLLVPLPGFPEPGLGGNDEVDAVDADNELTRLSRRLADVEAKLAEAERARDEARLSAAAREDRDGITQTTVTSLRATVERQLRHLVDVEATLARLTAERDEAVSQSDATEARVHTAEAALRRREWEIEALRREVQRLGRTPGPER